MDRLRALLTAAADGRFPPGDLEIEVLPAPRGRADAVVAFSAHNVVAADVDPGEVRAQLPAGDPAGPMSVAFLSWLGARLGAPPGSLDVVLVARGSGDPRQLERRDDADAHDRVARALRHRSDVAVYADADRSGVVILGRGLADRLEVSIELDPERRGLGVGTLLARSALDLVPRDELVFAQVAPGNVASLRTFLSAGYRPICSEVLFPRS